MPQIKMLSTEEMERYARAGVKQVIVQERQHHAALDKRFPGVLAEAIRALRANGHANGHKPLLQALEPPKKKRRKLSAEARKRISDAQKARWRKQRREAAKAS